MREGEAQSVQIRNLTKDSEVVHWHGLYLPPDIDGAMEEGTPMIAPCASTRYTMTALPAGFRWYHTHTFAGKNLTKAQYDGLHGSLLIEPHDNPAEYDREVFLGLHEWSGQFLSSGDGYMNPGLRRGNDQRQDARLWRCNKRKIRRARHDALPQ
jgi:FtsP/CotA-like multicopper oxidase with cupredoxin domain